MPQGQPTYVKYKDGTIRVYPAPSTPEENAKVLAQMDADEKQYGSGSDVSGAGNPTREYPGVMNATAAENMREIPAALGQTASLIGGLGKAQLPVRMLRTALGGAVQGAAEAGDPNKVDLNLPGRARGAATGALGEAALEGIFGKLSDLIPRGGLKAGMALGGVRGDTNEAVEAFMRERGRSNVPFTAPTLGAQTRNVAAPPTGRGPVATGLRAVDAVKNRQSVQRRIDTQGKALEAAETGSSVTTPLSSLMGSTSQQVKSGLHGPAGLQTGAQLKHGENVFLQNMAAIKKLETMGYDVSKMTEQQLNTAMRGARLGGAKNFAATNLSMRDLGNVRRASGREAEPIIAKRQRREPFDPSTDVPGAVGESIHSESKRLQDMLNPEVVPINQRLSDLFTIRNTNDALRGGGNVLSDVGQISTRGGLAHGVTQSVGKLTQTEAGLPRKLANTFGVGLLAPSMLSKGGFMGGTAMRAAPTAARLATPLSDDDMKRFIEDLLRGDGEESSLMRGVSMSPTRRREPE